MKEAEVEVAVCQFKRHKDRGYTHLCSEHLKGWLKKAYPYREMIPLTRPAGRNW